MEDEIELQSIYHSENHGKHYDSNLIPYPEKT